MSYSYYDIVVLIERIRRLYKWDKVSLLGHSFGGQHGFYYAGVFPLYVDLLIPIDSIGINPFVTQITKYMQHQIQALFSAEKDVMDFNFEFPAYTYDAALDKIVTGSKKAIDRECAKFLLPRKVKRSAKYPGRYQMSHDRRLIAMDNAPRVHVHHLEIAKSVVCPLLYIQGESSWYTQIKFKDPPLVKDYWKENNPRYQAISVPGNHYPHLTHPDECAPHIAEFIRTYRSANAKL